MSVGPVGSVGAAGGGMPSPSITPIDSSSGPTDNPSANVASPSPATPPQQPPEPLKEMNTETFVSLSQQREKGGVEPLIDTLKKLMEMVLVLKMLESLGQSMNPQ